MVYEYACRGCSLHFDVVKSAKDIERAEHCISCGKASDRIFIPSVNAIIRTKGLSNYAEFNPAFGKVIKNKWHRKYEAEKRGWIEVGADYKSPENIHKQFDSDRAKKREKSWEND